MNFTSVHRLSCKHLWFFVFILLMACASKQAIRNSDHLEIGAAHLNRAHGQLSEQEFQAVLVNDPKNWAAHYELGRLNSLRGNAQGAIDHFAMVIQEKPDNASAHMGIGWAMIGLHQLDNAKLHFNRALELGDEKILTLDGLGMVFIDQGLPEQARIFFDQALAVNANDPLTHEFLAEFYESRNNVHTADHNLMNGKLNTLQRAARYFKPFNLTEKTANFGKETNPRSSDHESGSKDGKGKESSKDHSGH